MIVRERPLSGSADRCGMSATRKGAVIVNHHIAQLLANDRMAELRREPGQRREQTTEPPRSRRTRRARHRRQFIARIRWEMR